MPPARQGSISPKFRAWALGLTRVGGYIFSAARSVQLQCRSLIDDKLDDAAEDDRYLEHAGSL